MYSVEGEIIECFEEITNEFKIIVVSDDRDKFKGLQYLEGGQPLKQFQRKPRSTSHQDSKLKQKN